MSGLSNSNVYCEIQCIYALPVLQLLHMLERFTITVILCTLTSEFSYTLTECLTALLESINSIPLYTSWRCVSGRVAISLNDNILNVVFI